LLNSTLVYYQIIFKTLIINKYRDLESNFNSDNLIIGQE
jgi:hypothetical protein